MAIRVLGPVEVDGGESLRPRDRVVLAALAVWHGRALTSEEIADAVLGGGYAAPGRHRLPGFNLGNDLEDLLCDGYEPAVEWAPLTSQRHPGSAGASRSRK